MNDLSLIETRVLGALVEKQRTVPDSYPLTLNALVAGCNQKSSRAPVMEASESEVQGALDSLITALQGMPTTMKKSRKLLRRSLCKRPMPFPEPDRAHVAKCRTGSPIISMNAG